MVSLHRIMMKFYWKISLFKCLNMISKQVYWENFLLVSEFFCMRCQKPFISYSFYWWAKTHNSTSPIRKSHQNKLKHAESELCQAQVKLGLAKLVLNSKSPFAKQFRPPFVKMRLSCICQKHEVASHLPPKNRLSCNLVPTVLM